MSPLFLGLSLLVYLTWGPVTLAYCWIAVGLLGVIVGRLR